MLCARFMCVVYMDSAILARKADLVTAFFGDCTYLALFRSHLADLALLVHKLVSPRE